MKIRLVISADCIPLCNTNVCAIFPSMYLPDIWRIIFATFFLPKGTECRHHTFLFGRAVSTSLHKQSISKQQGNLSAVSSWPHSFMSLGSFFCRICVSIEWCIFPYLKARSGHTNWGSKDFSIDRYWYETVVLAIKKKLGLRFRLLFNVFLFPTREAKKRRYLILEEGTTVERFWAAFFFSSQNDRDVSMQGVRDIVFTTRIIMGTLCHRKFVQGHIVLGCPLSLRRWLNNYRD